MTEARALLENPLSLREALLSQTNGFELAELEMISAAFDGDDEKLPQYRYFIISPPRSGSYWLCRQLWGAGLGLPHEYLNRLHLRRLSKRWGTPLSAFQPKTKLQRFAKRLGLKKQLATKQDKSPAPDLQGYLAEAMRRRSHFGWFGLKIQPIHLKELDLCPELAFPNWMQIPLLRRDQRRQLASYLFSRASGAYDTGLITTNEGEGLQSLMSSSLQDETTALLAEQNRLIVELSKRSNIPPLWMEDLIILSGHELQRALTPYLPPLADLEPTFIPIVQRGGPIHSTKQQLLRELASSLPDSLVDRLNDSIR